jgi:hypothetical protein
LECSIATHAESPYKKMNLYGRLVLMVIAYFQFHHTSTAQTTWNWYNPQKEQAIGGQGWKSIGYGRFPKKAKEDVRPPVWNLSQHSAGLRINFASQSDSIQVKYLPTGKLEMPHMPATGVSGLDLYIREEGGNWKWVKGAYQFSDTVRYTFSISGLPKTSYEAMLYLPLYNGVNYLELGVNGTLTFKNQKSERPPLVVYGTSIAQGACASRPGMAWPAQLERLIDYPIINLGFSGNGRLEPEVLKYISEISASLYILDCLPNLVSFAGYSEDVVKSKLKEAVHNLKNQHPNTPILLVEHAGYSEYLTSEERNSAVEDVNEWSRSVYRQLLSEGVEEIYYLEKDDIHLDMDATVDGTHPSDWGMYQYAKAYQEILGYILD